MLLTDLLSVCRGHFSGADLYTKLNDWWLLGRYFINVKLSAKATVGGFTKQDI